MNPYEMVKELAAENALLKLEIEELKKEKEKEKEKKEKEKISLPSKLNIIFFNYSVNDSVCETSLSKEKGEI